MHLKHALWGSIRVCVKTVTQGCSCLMSLILLAGGRRALSDDTQAFHAHHQLCDVSQIVCQRKDQRDVCDVEIKRNCHFLIQAVCAQRHDAPTALAYIQPAYMHAAYLPIIHHHLQTLLAPSLGKTEAWRLRHSPCHCPASEQWFWPMASVCYLLPLHFCLTYYVMFPESIAKTT